MKTLVIQLARLGDIYQTWPCLRALKRQDPEGELHVLTRRKFRDAMDGIDVVEHFWHFDSRLILEPVFESCEAALKRIEELCFILRSQGFDRVINLSFSPVSSYLTQAITFSTQCDVRGYTRTQDGYLKIPDDGSAYFYAQVGPGRANRLHLTDLFAHIAGVELSHNDWRPPLIDQTMVRKFAVKADSVLVHIGASQAGKTFAWTKWSQIVNGLLAQTAFDVVLIGATPEIQIAEKIMASAGHRRPINLVGQTTLAELFALMSSSQLLIGGDSGPIHVASLCGTPVLNFSFPVVNFWETGPKSTRSRIICFKDESEFASDSLVQEALSMLSVATGPDQGAVRLLPTVDVPSTTKPYVSGPIVQIDDCPFVQDQFRWQLVSALYLGDRFPEAASPHFLNGVSKLADINALALEQVSVLMRGTGAQDPNATNQISGEQTAQRQTASLILDRADEIIEQIAQLVPDLAPVIGWFQTERLRIGPMPIDDLAKQTCSIHRKLDDILAIYGGTKAGKPNSEGNFGHDDTLMG